MFNARIGFLMEIDYTISCFLKRTGTGVQGGRGSIHVLVVQDSSRPASIEANGNGARGSDGNRERQQEEEMIRQNSTIVSILSVFCVVFFE